MIFREMSLFPKVCLYALTLGLTVPLITHGSPFPNNQGPQRNDAVKKRLIRRERTPNIPRVVENHDDESKFLSEKGNAEDSDVKFAIKRSSPKPAGTLDKPSRPEERNTRTNMDHRKRILDVITGAECGAFGCADDDTDDGEFPFGSDDDNTDYGRPHQDNEGYWVECEEDPTRQCYYDGRYPPGHWSRCDGPRGWCYYFDEDAVTGYWQECEDDPNYDCYYYNDDPPETLGYWEDCDDNQDDLCYYYYDIVWISNGQRHKKPGTKQWKIWLPSNLWYKSYQIPKLKCFSSRLPVVLAQCIEIRCYVENEDVVGAAATSDAPTTSGWSTILLLTKVCDWYQMFEGTKHLRPDIDAYNINDKWCLNIVVNNSHFMDSAWYRGWWYWWKGCQNRCSLRQSILWCLVFTL